MLVPASASAADDKVRNNIEDGGRDKDKEGGEKTKTIKRRASNSLFRGIAWRCKCIEHIIRLCKYETSAYRIGCCGVTVRVPVTTTSTAGAGVTSATETKSGDAHSDTGPGADADGTKGEGEVKTIVLKGCRTFVSNLEPV